MVSLINGIVKWFILINCCCSNWDRAHIILIFQFDCFSLMWKQENHDCNQECAAYTTTLPFRSYWHTSPYKPFFRDLSHALKISLKQPQRCRDTGVKINFQFFSEVHRWMFLFNNCENNHLGLINNKVHKQTHQNHFLIMV